MQSLRPVALSLASLMLLAVAATASAQDTRPPDLSNLPPHEVNPRPNMGTLPPPSPMTQAQALDTLRARGFLGVTHLAQDAQGNWHAEAQRQFNGPVVHLELDRNGDVSEQSR